MPKFLEKKLMAEYGPNSSIPYKVMNSIGAMHGNQVTAKGERMQAQHDAKVRVVKPMHPKMHQRAAMVKEAHQHLGSAIPGFHGLPGRQRMMAVQHHVNLRLGKVR